MVREFSEVALGLCLTNVQGNGKLKIEKQVKPCTTYS